MASARLATPGSPSNGGSRYSIACSASTICPVRKASTRRWASATVMPANDRPLRSDAPPAQGEEAAADDSNDSNDQVGHRGLLEAAAKGLRVVVDRAMRRIQAY